MILKENSYIQKKDGVTAYSYDIKKLDAFGEGLPADKELVLQATYTATYKEIKFKDKNTGADKTMLSIKVPCVPVTKIDNFKGSAQYGSAWFSLPDKCWDIAPKIKKGDIIRVKLRSFMTTDNNGKEAKRVTWECKLNEEFGNQATLAPKQTPVVTVNIPFEFPSSLNTFVDGCVKDKDAFLSAFVNDNIIMGVEEPETFYKWLDDSAACGTEYYVGLAEVAGLTTIDVISEKKKMFNEILRRIDA